MGLLIAGARATGTTASWLLTFLGGHQDWRDKARAEVEMLLTNTSTGPSSQPLSARLATIPLDVWEEQTPVLDAIIKETTRVAQPHTAMRRNLGPDCYIDGKRIPTGAYVIYPFSDVHLDPELYPDPWRFDPSRKEVDSNVPFGYVGWGGGKQFSSSGWMRMGKLTAALFPGKTLCLGTRLAKVELKLVTALFIMSFDHAVIDPSGEPATTLPMPNWNDILLCRPRPGSFYLGYSRSTAPL
jgi:cytochrome P450